MLETFLAQHYLRAASNAIEDRAKTRDVDAERSMERTVKTFNALTGNRLRETDGWIFMICLKLARAQQGEFHADDYIDLCGYAALTGECESRRA